MYMFAPAVSEAVRLPELYKLFLYLKNEAVVLTASFLFVMKKIVVNYSIDILDDH